MRATDEKIEAPTGPEAVAEWRFEVLQKVFTHMFLLLAVLLLVETGVSTQTGEWHALPALGLGVVLQAIAAFARTLSIRVRGSIFALAACAGVGFGLPNLGFALPIPFIVAAMTVTLLALCLDQRFALRSLTAIVLVMFAAAAYVCLVRAPYRGVFGSGHLVLDPTRFSNWVRVIVVFGAVALVTIGSVGFLVRRLEQAVQHNQQLFVHVEHASRERIEALEEREQLQTKVRRSGELQIMGMLSATVAHDFNNLLMVIQSNAASLKVDATGEAREEVTDIERAVERATDLCRRLLTLAGERISSVELAELNQVVEGELPILRRLLTARVEVQWAPAEPLWLRCARTEMRQALLNLCANARDAMPKGGTLRISTAKVERRRPEADAAEDYACLMVSDTGSGMDASTRERLFQPFFTTKGAKGTGLGMSVVAAAVEHHRGFVEVESEPGKGTTFSLFFPLVAAGQSDAARPSNADSEPFAHPQ